MKNKNGTTEDLREFHPNGKWSYDYCSSRYDFQIESTFDDRGNQLTYKNSNGECYEYTFDEDDKQLTYQHSDGYSVEYNYNPDGSFAYATRL